MSASPLPCKQVSTATSVLPGGLRIAGFYLDVSTAKDKAQAAVSWIKLLRNREALWQDGQALYALLVCPQCIHMCVSLRRCLRRSATA